MGHLEKAGNFKAKQEKLENLVKWRPRYVVASGNPELAGNSESSEVSEARKAAIQWMETLGPETVVPEFGTYPELTDEETLDAVFSELQIKGRVPKVQVEYSNQDFERCLEYDLQKLTEDTDYQIEDLKKEVDEKDEKNLELRKELWKIIDERQVARRDVNGLTLQLCDHW